MPNVRQTRKAAHALNPDFHVGAPAAEPGSAAANASASDDSYFGNTDSGRCDCIRYRDKDIANCFLLGPHALA